MLRLTKSKIRGFRLPDLPQLGKGNTSMIFDNGDTVIGYTVEWLKCHWLHYGLAVIDGFEEVGTAEYEGFKRGWGWDGSRGHFLRGELYVYRYEMPKIEIAGSRNREVRQLRKEVEECRGSLFNNPIGNWWTKLRDSEHKSLSEPANFIGNYAHDDVFPDFGPGDWGYINGELTCIDPFHHKDISEFLRLSGR